MSVTVNSGNATGFADGTIFSTTPGDGGIVQVVQLPGTQPVSGTFWQATQPVSGPLTDAQLRAAAVPVSGTFWQATQPVSIAAAVAVTGTFWQATQPVSSTQLPAALAAHGGLPIEGVAGGVAVPISGSVGITGSVVVAGPLTDTQLRASAVPVSLATNTPDVTDRAARLLGHVTVDNASLAVTGTFWQATQPVSGTVTVTPPTLTKGTQGATGFSTQDLKDSGRNTRVFMLDTITAAPVAEALASVVQWYGNAAVATTTTPAVVPAGKTLRLISWKIQYQSLATVGYAVVRVRVNTGGVAALASPLAFSFEAGTNSGSATTAVTGAVTTSTGNFPEGFELPAGAGIGFSVAGYGPTGALTLEGGVRFMVAGYEY